MKRFIIGGASPNIRNIPDELYKTGTVIGCNDWFLHHDCDIYLALDFSTLWRKYRKQIIEMHKKGVPIYARGNPNRPPFATPGVKVNWFMRHTPRVPEHINDKKPLADKFTCYLFWWGTTPTASIHLAYCLGATECVLAGFDCHGNERWDGYRYSAKDLNFKPDQIRRGEHRKGWTNTANWINRGMRMLAQHITIYKTLKASPLEVPYLDPTSAYAINPSDETSPAASGVPLDPNSQDDAQGDS